MRAENQESAMPWALFLLYGTTSVAMPDLRGVAAATKKARRCGPCVMTVLRPLTLMAVSGRDVQAGSD
jgi:hypothetical protein